MSRTHDPRLRARRTRLASRGTIPRSRVHVRSSCGGVRSMYRKRMLQTHDPGPVAPSRAVEVSGLRADARDHSGSRLLLLPPPSSFLPLCFRTNQNLCSTNRFFAPKHRGTWQVARGRGSEPGVSAARGARGGRPSALLRSRHGSTTLRYSGTSALHHSPPCPSPTFVPSWFTRPLPYGRGSDSLLIPHPSGGSTPPPAGGGSGAARRSRRTGGSRRDGQPRP